MPENFCCTGRFLASGDYAEAKGVIYGVPMDYTVSFKPGSRFGPAAIRQVSYGLEEYSFRMNRSLEEIAFADLGDLDLPVGHVEDSIKAIYNAQKCILSEGKVPFALGGEHLVSWPLIKAAADVYHKNIKVIHFDAHADLRSEFLGRELSHATVMRKVCQYIGSRNVYQFGIRSGDKDEKRFAEEHVNFYPYAILPYLEEVLKQLKGQPLYVTVDIDVVDPAFAPGTGTPEPGGVTSSELLRAVEMLQGHTLVGFDLVEVSPQHDPGSITAILAAKVIREALLAVL